MRDARTLTLSTSQYSKQPILPRVMKYENIISIGNLQVPPDQKYQLNPTERPVYMCSFPHQDVSTICTCTRPQVEVQNM